MAYFQPQQFYGAGVQYAPTGYGAFNAAPYNPYASYGVPHQMAYAGGWQLPAHLQPLSMRQPTSAQQLFSGNGPQAGLFHAQPYPQQHLLQAAGSVIGPGGLRLAAPAQQIAAPTFVSAPVVPSIAGSVSGGPVDLYASAASAASAYSAYSQHSAAASVVSQASVLSAPGSYGYLAQASRRRTTQYGRWKDTQGVVARVPLMRNRNPDPLEPPRRTNFRKWKDVQEIFGRLGLK